MHSICNTHIKVDPFNVFHSQLVESHTNREKALRQCLTLSAQNLQLLKDRKKTTPNDVQVIKLLRNEQTKVRRSN